MKGEMKRVFKEPPLISAAKRAETKAIKDHKGRWNRTERLQEKMKIDVLKKEKRLRLNWFYFVDRKEANSGDGFQAKKVHPCPFCEGEKKVIVFDKTSPSTGYCASNPCPVCRGEGDAWFKYGLFEIQADTGYGYGE